MLQDPSVETQMINVLTQDAWEIDWDKLGEGLRDTFSKDLIKSNGEKETGFSFYDWSAAIAAEAIAKAGGEGSTVKRSHVYGALGMKISSSTSTSKNLSRGSVNEKYIAKVVRETLKEEGLAKEKKAANSRRGAKLFKIFKPAFDEVVEQMAYSKEDKESFLNKVESYFNAKSASLIAGTRSVASGDITEKIGFLITEAYIETVGADASMVTKIDFTGGTSEEDVRKNLKGSFNTALKNWHGLDKQSYSDFILYVRGNSVRVQAKNYLGIQEAILNKKDRLMQLDALGSVKTLEQFMGMINSSTTRVTEVPEEELKYVMANEIWFQLAGSWIGGKDKSGSTKTERIQQRGSGSTILDTFLSNSLTAYIGVQLEGTEVVPELSNLFYLVNNMRLVPTYTIVDQILEGFENFEKSATKLRVKIGKSGVTANAEDYYKSKQEAADAAGTHLIRGRGYVDA